MTTVTSKTGRQVYLMVPPNGGAPIGIAADSEKALEILKLAGWKPA